MIVPSFLSVNYFLTKLSEEQIQPASIDLTLDKVFKFKSSGKILKEGKELPTYEEIEPKNGIFFLERGAYKIRFNEIVKIPEDCAAISISRSSLFRSGAFIVPGFWDPGYEGRGESLLVVENPHGIIIEKGARIAQLIFFKLLTKPEKVYRGSYFRENI